ncbi:Hypothetical predicted protein [Olea europaea subsp. europaea]|uniref:Uncharacterized protein n=1 Tax=Olea europaea subsp. europaea TaxID=158383 RepID=A0A8S0SFX4_OLEEU|nr:Hypothetical predicted protein [Olea europaea subsp. europaea]
MPSERALRRSGGGDESKLVSARRQMARRDRGRGNLTTVGESHCGVMPTSDSNSNLPPPWDRLEPFNGLNLILADGRVHCQEVKCQNEPGSCSCSSMPTRIKDKRGQEDAGRRASPGCRGGLT